MAGILSSNLKGSTIAYNGVQFGGADSDHPSTPPEYQLQGHFVYDDAGRTIKGVQYALTVKTIFYGESESKLSVTIDDARDRLSVPGKELKIAGIGLGTISTDLQWGPKPQDIAFSSRGLLACECVWIVHFFVSECTSPGTSKYAWTAFNYDTTWQNDFEGMCTRTISGYVEIAASRKVLNNKRSAEIVADEVRNSLTITVPPGFRRMNNVWRESADKTRLDFVVVDEQLPGDPFPPGITLADGEFSFDSQGPGFAKANVSMSMTLKTAPNVPRGIAGVIFIQAMLAKQAAMAQRLQSSGGMAIPTRLSIRNRKWDGARITDCSASWELSRCLNAMLNASGIWEPLIGGDYALWRTSMDKMWGNRGVAGLTSLASDDIIIDVCAGVQSATIGNTQYKSDSQDASGQFQLSCPEIPPDGGWIAYDTRVVLLREDKQTLHRKAVSYVQAPITIPGSLSGGISTGSPPYSQGQSGSGPDGKPVSDSHVLEFHGKPVVRVMLQYKQLRFKHPPKPPVLLNIGGNKVTENMSNVGSPRVAFDIFTCPVWYAEGWRIYTVDGYVGTLKLQGSPDSCAAPSTSPSA